MDTPDASRDEAVPLVPTSETMHRLRRTWSFGDPIRLIEERLIVATAEAWPSMSESTDSTWKAKAVELAGVGLVIASRLEA